MYVATQMDTENYPFIPPHAFVFEIPIPVPTTVLLFKKKSIFKT